MEFGSSAAGNGELVAVYRPGRERERCLFLCRDEEVIEWKNPCYVAWLSFINNHQPL